MDTIKKYLDTINDLNHREVMKAVLQWVIDTYDQLQPRIAWNQPMFTDHGTYIIGFSVSKQHMAVSPEEAGIIHFSEDIKEAGLDHTKMLVRFPWDRPVNYDLLAKMIEYNIFDKADCTTFWRK